MDRMLAHQTNMKRIQSFSSHNPCGGPDEVVSSTKFLIGSCTLKSPQEGGLGIQYNTQYEWVDKLEIFMKYTRYFLTFLLTELDLFRRTSHRGSSS